jgi:phospholipase C
MAINPAPGSTFADAEHVVILMQENRSFDHCFGSLQGVRGFADPRAITLPNGNPVWLQSSSSGQTHAPFRLNIRDSNATWLGSVPHGWHDQTDARNGGKYDGWVDAKKTKHPEIPLTLGYHTREDLPFYYALADAFTLCDQSFCSSLTGTSPNRLYLWTGTTRENARTIPRVRNEEIDDVGVPASWKTFPERLEEHGVSWKVYQNELSIDVGLDGQAQTWLGNFGDNPLEYFAQYNVRSHPAHQRHNKMKGKPAGDNLALSPSQQRLSERAFTTNVGDPNYHQLATLRYLDGTTPREMSLPKGDVLYQFRKDVATGDLPTVSWLVAPMNFSDHPASPFYGAWYVSETLDILTLNPQVWKKTIFILCYDENDGYFDHVPPFTPPISGDPKSGKASASIDCAIEYLDLQADLKRQPKEKARGGVLGLGYRVPLLVASPWSRGGRINSQVFDHTSILQFLEGFLGKKLGHPIVEENISSFRRAICGDLSSVFVPYHGNSKENPTPVKRDAFVQTIHQAQFKPKPSGYGPLSKKQIQLALRDPRKADFLPTQEKGIRVAAALPYQLEVDGELTTDRRSFQIRFRAGTELFGARSAGAPFVVYANDGTNPRAYALVAGDALEDTWSLDSFSRAAYALRVHGPNGFFRAFSGTTRNPPLVIACAAERTDSTASGNVQLTVENPGRSACTFVLSDLSYKTRAKTHTVAAGARTSLVVDLSTSHGWYDLRLAVKGASGFSQRYAGHIETGKASFTDPAMGRVV